ncbi:serine hydrolase, partial [Chloroflexota bacterium]
MRWIYLIIISLAIVLTIIQLVTYSRLLINYPSGMSLGGVPVGGLDAQEAAQRVLQVYSLPIELRYRDAIIQLDPGLLGFNVDIASMIAAADLQREKSSFWVGFWNYLWNQSTSSVNIPLVSSVSDDQIREYLQEEISTRYDTLPTAAQPIPGTTEFTAGVPGQTINIDRSILLITNALKSPSNRLVTASSQQTSASRPQLASLQLLIENIIVENSFDGIIGVFLLDLQTGTELHLGYQSYQPVSVNPDIAFSASSTIKIPIMVSVFKNSNGLLDSETSTWMSEMLKLSENPAADNLMDTLEPDRGPIIITNDLKELGLLDTFIAGYFYNNAPNLLPYYSTSANSRTDLSTEPDWYSQTTPSDMGMLLADIYQCAEIGGGALIASFPGKITKNSCQEMIQYLKEDKIGLLIEAGVPDGTLVAHKHGWILDVVTGVYQEDPDPVEFLKTETM